MRFAVIGHGLAAAGLGIFLVQASSSASASPALRTTVGVVEQVDGEDNRTWFDLLFIDQRFAFDPRKIAAPGEVAKMLADSQATSKSISVHFFVDGAIFDVGAAKPIYAVHDITYDGRTVQIEQALPLPDPNAVPQDRDVAASALAKAIALAGDPDSAEARQALSISIDSTALEPALKALALKTRARLNADDALQNWPAGAERDKRLFAALQDAEAWQAAAPDDVHAAGAVAQELRQLGAYDEAIALWRGALKKWPQENFRLELGIAATYRTLGQYDRSLAELDSLVKTGDATGMAYHYHRGWTLSKAGRFEEAVAEFTAGMKDQPDYSGAFMQRACALAQMGKLGEAIADWHQVVKLQDAWGGDTPPAPGIRHDRERNAEIEKALDASHARDPAAKTDAACTGFWSWGEEMRERSALLPPLQAR